MLPGDTVGDRYEILELIGAGGMGAVYRARHLVSQREVALKVLHPGAAENPRAVARFKREASAAARGAWCIEISSLPTYFSRGKNHPREVCSSIRSVSAQTNRWIVGSRSADRFSHSRGVLDGEQRVSANAAQSDVHDRLGIFRGPAGLDAE